MNCLVKRVMPILFLLSTDALFGAEQETKKPGRFDKREYQKVKSESPRSVSQLSSNDAQESTVELQQLVTMPADKKLVRKGSLTKDSLLGAPQVGLDVIHVPMLEDHHVSPAAFLAAGIEPQLESLLQGHTQEITALKEENERALRRAKRRACIGSCPAFTCAGLTVVLTACGMAYGIPLADDKNKCN